MSLTFCIVMFTFLVYYNLSFMFTCAWCVNKIHAPHLARQIYRLGINTSLYLQKMSQKQDLSSELSSLATQIKAELINKSERWNQQHNAVGDCFGGFGIMLYLCLTNPNCKDYMNDEALQCLKDLAYSNGLIDENDAKKQDVEVQPIEIITSLPTTITSIKRSNDHDAFFSNLTQFYSHSITIIANPYNNSYHTMLSLSLEQTQFIVSKILYSKWLYFSVLSIYIVLYSSSQIYWYTTGNYDSIYAWLFATPNIIVSLFAVSYILSANVDISLSTVETFDFWYKTYNIIIGIVCVYFVGYYSSALAYFTAYIAFFSVFMVVFLFDAISVSKTNKLILTLLCAALLIYGIQAVYFSSPNVYWNPFDNQHTRINFKSSLISAWTNVTLFSLKPIFRQIVTWCRHRKANKSKGSKIDGKLKQKSYFLYRRPIIKWQMNHHNQEITSVEFNKA